MLFRSYTDSSYLINGVTKWLNGWKRNGWKTKTKQDVLNRDLWMKLDDLISFKEVVWKYIGGHIGVSGNERCDVIATTFADVGKPNLFDGDISDYKIKNILDITHDAELLKDKKSSSARSRASAYSYVSLVKGKVMVHQTWPECEKRVKGVKGAKYKKALNQAEEKELIREYTNK